MPAFAASPGRWDHREARRRNSNNRRVAAQHLAARQRAGENYAGSSVRFANVGAGGCRRITTTDGGDVSWTLIRQER